MARVGFVTVHVAGAGLAGLAAALTAARAGHQVVVHEAAGLAGGRCRSFFDPTLGRVIDNGTHVVLGANRAALGFLGAMGGGEAMVPAASRPRHASPSWHSCPRLCSWAGRCRS